MKNKTLKITALLFIGVAFGINAQSFEKGQKDVNLGIGLGNTYASSSSASGSTTSTPPISGSLEFGVTDAISVGGYVAYTGTTWTYAYGSYTDKRTWSYYIVGVRGAFHFAQFIKNDKVDLYAGLMLGDVIAKDTYTTTNPTPGYNSTTSTQSSGGFIFSPSVGCRYRFTDNVGIFGELGYGIATFNIGVNFKF